MGVSVLSAGQFSFLNFMSFIIHCPSALKHTHTHARTYMRSHTTWVSFILMHRALTLPETIKYN